MTSVSWRVRAAVGAASSIGTRALEAKGVVVSSTAEGAGKALLVGCGPGRGGDGVA